MTDYEKVARDIIYNDDYFKKYAEIVPEVGEKLETYVFKIRDALRTAVEKEREECAKVAKTFDCNCMSHEGDDKEAIAQAIRTRGKDTPQNG